MDGPSMEKPDEMEQGEQGEPSSASASASASASSSAEPLVRIWGRIDAEDEDSLPQLGSVSDDGLRHSATDRRKMLDSSSDHYYPHRCAGGTECEVCRPTTGQFFPNSLPSELVDNILSFLSPIDLVSVSRVCHTLHAHAGADHLWQALVQANVPGITVSSSYPFSTFRELYIAHDPRWFLPKYKIWFCGRDLTGKLVLVRYDDRRGCIEGYRMLAISKPTTYQHWEADDQVIIHAFEPEVKLHMDKPVLQLRADSADAPIAQPKASPALRFLSAARAAPSSSTNPDWQANRIARETPMLIDNVSPDTMHSNFMLARPMSQTEAATRAEREFPYGNIWPPPTVPARHRVSAVNFPGEGFTLPPGDRPTKRADVSDQAFHIHSWMELQNRSYGRRGGLGGVSLYIGEEVTTYSTLDPVLYTPTADKPWRGIWVGDYSGHGCEFLLINQPDSEPFDESAVERKPDETDDEFEQRKRDAAVYRGRLEAIKLTGDPNVPRGEYTFVADDLGEEGFVTVVQSPPFAGVRVVKSKGHVARTGFANDKYIESQLLLISPNRLAQYWVGFGHISFFERVDIDRFLKP